MTLLFCDSFDHYATSDMLRKWNSKIETAGGPTVTIGAFGRSSTNGLRANRTAQNQIREAYLTRTLGSAVGTIIVGFAFKPTTNFPVVAGLWILNLTDGGTDQVEIGLNSSGQLVARRAGVVLGTSTFGLSLETTYYLEVKVLISDTIGTVTVRVDGIERLALTNQDTKATTNATVDGVKIGFRSGNENVIGWAYDFDDLYVCDTAGAQNNDFLGDIRVEALLPSGAGNYAQWALTGAATNREAVDESTPDDDTTYVSSPTVGQKDSYAYGNLTPTAGAVKAVVHQHLARKDDGGVRTIRPLTRISAVDYFGSNVNPGTTYSFIQQVTELSPATGVAWTVSEINGAEFGQDVVA